MAGRTFQIQAAGAEHALQMETWTRPGDRPGRVEATLDGEPLAFAYQVLDAHRVRVELDGRAFTCQLQD